MAQTVRQEEWKEEKIASAGGSTVSKNVLKTKQLFDDEMEQERLKQYVNLALDPANGEEWTVFKCKDDRISVKYTKLPNDKFFTIRGQMDFEMDIDLLHEFAHGMYNDIFPWEKGNDPMATDIHAVNHIDENHTVVYGAFNAGFGLWPRDFCWMKRRFMFQEYKGPDGKTYKAGGDLCYSIDESHPNFVGQAKGHVRAWLAMSGAAFVKKTDKICTASYIVNLDPRGWIPPWIANLVAPEQGLIIKRIADNYPKIPPIMQKRWAKDKKEKEKEKQKEKKKENQNTKGKNRAKGVFVE